MNENDKLISGFMDSISDLPYGEHTLNYYEVWIGKGLHYHDSWDWLMPVVEQIRGLGYIVEIGNRLTDNFKQRYFVDIRHILRRDKFVSTTFNDDGSIKLTHEAVIEFIEWYNENK